MVVHVRQTAGHDLWIKTCSEQRERQCSPVGWSDPPTTTERNKVPEEAHRAVNRPNRLLQSYEPAPIRFHVDWQATGLPADVQAFLRDDFIPEALGYLSRHMKVRAAR